MKENDTNPYPGKYTNEDNFDLWRLLEQTAFAVGRARDLELKQHGLTPAQASILYTLIACGGESNIEKISNFTMRQPHSVLTLIGRMAKQGLVRVVKESRRKKAKIFITEGGRELYAKTKHSSIEMIFSILSKEKKQIFASFLKTIGDNARALLGIDFKPPFL